MSTFTDSVQTLLGKLFARKAQEVRTELVAVANTVAERLYWKNIACKYKTL